MPFTKKTCGERNVDNVFDDVYRILNKLDKDMKTVKTGEGGGPVINLPFGWKLVCTPSAFKVTQYGVDKGLEL
jgi:hypothetical protein